MNASHSFPENLELSNKALDSFYEKNLSIRYKSSQIEVLF